MAKTAKKATALSASEIDLNRWCIEMAMRWPVHEVGGYANAASQYHQQLGQYPRSMVDADVLGRAAKIEAWVKARR